MTTQAKVIMWIVIAVVAIGGVWWWMSMSQTASAPTTGQANQQTSTQTADTASNGISAHDNSNAALQTDLSNIDGQMNGFSSDNASVNSGMNDQPVQQSQL